MSTQTLANIYELVESISAQHSQLTEDESWATLKTTLDTLTQKLERLHSSEKQYEDIFNNMAIGIFQSTPEGRYLRANPALSRIYGFESADMLVDELTDIGQQLYVDPDRRAQFKMIMGRSGLVSDFEAEVFRQDGTTTWISETARAVHDEHGVLSYYEGTVKDITASKQVEHTILQQSTELEAFNRVARVTSIASSPDDLRNMLHQVVKEFIDLFSLTRGVVALRQQDPFDYQVVVDHSSIVGSTVLTEKSLPVNDEQMRHSIEIGQAEILYESIVAASDEANQAEDVAALEFPNLMQAAQVMVIPLVAQGDAVGLLLLGRDTKPLFTPGELNLGQTLGSRIAGTVANVRLLEQTQALLSEREAAQQENERLLKETQHRSERLHTAAQVSRAASSILDVDALIEQSVNLIQEKFEFYYVGLFLVEGDHAVLKAGTGEAGRTQLERRHRLKLGGGSMIGWSIQNKQAKIALDVGEEKVNFFKNPILPLTRSEMALPLISREEALGALTIQSVEERAFSDEDITLLQTMADQLANAMNNGRLFATVAQAQQTAEIRLMETQALQQFSQSLASTMQLKEILEIFVETCVNQIGFDYLLVCLVDERRERIQGILGHGVSESHVAQTIKPIDSSDIIADIIRTGKTEQIQGWDDRFDEEIYQREGHVNWHRLFTPITVRQTHIGLVEGGYKQAGQPVSDNQVRLLRAFIDQLALAIDNARRYEASRRAARREALIKEITTQVRASTNVDTILQTTAEQIGHALGGQPVFIHLNDDQFPMANGS